MSDHLWEMRDMPDGRTLELWAGDAPALVLTQGENRVRVDLPQVKGVVAALDGRAPALVEETGERYYEAEIHRLVGELLLS